VTTLEGASGAAPVAAPGGGPALEAEVARFLHHEAELLDEGRYEEWLDLLADDLRYAMPLRLNVAHGDVAARGTTRPGEEVCWFDEGKATLTKRVEQIRTGVHWAEEPFSRVTRMVANIQVGPLEPATGDVTVSSRFLLYRNRVADETDLFVGRRTDTLRRRVTDGGPGWELHQRLILLDQNVLLAKNLTMFF
jgi:3-phenylpropionate/cinnamic acid dioxygenase small subunit